MATESLASASASSSSALTPFELIENLAQSAASAVGIRNRLVIEAVKLAAIGSS
jgi:hypothetical protein